MVTNRMKQFDELILRSLSEIIFRLFPEDFSSITKVNVSKDLSFAKVWISSKDNVDQVVKKYQNSQWDIKKELAKKVMARRIPKLFFVADKTEEKAMIIEELINKTKK